MAASASTSSSSANQRVSSILSHLSPAATASAKKAYKFTVDSNILTAEQRDFYEENGYLLIRGLLDQNDIDLYTKTFIDIANGNRPRTPLMVVMKDIVLAKEHKNTAAQGEKFVTKIQDWCDDENFFHFCQHPNIVKYAQGIIGRDLRAMHTMLINKPTDLGKGSSRHPPHQDLWYFPFRQPEHIVAAWTALQKINIENGCLFVLPGSHKQPLIKHSYPNDGIVNAAYHGIQNLSREADMEKHKFLMVEMEAGDTLFFHPLLIHGSGRNTSPNFRKAICVHYANPTLCDYIDVDGTMQEDIAQEVIQMMKNKGVEMTYNDLWRMKSRHVIGDIGRLGMKPK